MINSILIVCTGNSCRSAMAEGFLRKLLKERGCEDINVTSAGIATIPGMMASSNAIEVMKTEGVDISEHHAQMVNADMIKEAELILCMEPVHVRAILNMVPEAKDKTYLLLEYVYGKDAYKSMNPWVVDPIGKPKEVYESVFIVLKDAIERLVKKVCE